MYDHVSTTLDDVIVVDQQLPGERALRTEAVMAVLTNCAFCCGITFLLLSCATYISTIGVGWWLRKSDIEFQPDPLYHGTLAVTFPALSLLSLCLALCRSKHEGVQIFIAVFIIAVLIGSLAIASLVGAVFYVLGATEFPADGGSAEAFPSAVAASSTAFVAAISCCCAVSCTLCGICVAWKEDTDEDRKKLLN